MSWAKKNAKPLGDDITAINKAALALLGRREYSQKELRAKLTERGADKEVLDAALSRLVEVGYLDDSRYAAAFVRDRRDFHPCGAALIRRDLAAKGVSAELIDIAIEEEYDPERERETLRDLVAKAMAAAPGDEQGRDKYLQRLIRRYLGKGFPQNMVIEELQDIRR